MPMIRSREHSRIIVRQSDGSARLGVSRSSAQSPLASAVTPAHRSFGSTFGAIVCTCSNTAASQCNNVGNRTVGSSGREDLATDSGREQNGGGGGPERRALTSACISPFHPARSSGCTQQRKKELRQQTSSLFANGTPIQLVDSHSPSVEVRGQLYRREN